MSLVLILPSINGGGYGRTSWIIAGHYLIAKKKFLDFIIDDTNWEWKNKNGWDDYFHSAKLLKTCTLVKEPIYYFNCDQLDITELSQFTLAEYNLAYKDIIILNDALKTQLNTIMQQYNLIPQNFDAIMIRRGSKLFGESALINTEVYLNKLIEKNTHTIFLQTDDYNCYDELKNIIEQKNLNINLITICPEYKRGGQGAYKDELDIYRTGVDVCRYPQYITEFLKNKKAENEYTPDEMKIHMEEMIIGLEICLLARHLSLDTQSNVTRMLYARYYDTTNLFDNDNLALRPDVNKQLISPVYPFKYC